MSAAACTSAPVTWPGAPSTCGTRITSAPSPSSMRARAGLLPADIVTSKGCPSAAQATASPAPMLPLVISTTGMPGLSRPSARAASRMALAARSFTLPPGCRNSALATSRPGRRGSGPTRSGACFLSNPARRSRACPFQVHGRRGGPASRTEIVGNASAGVSLAAQRRPPPLRSAPPPPRPAWAADPARPGSRAAAPRRTRPAAPCSRPDCATPTQSPAARAWPQLIGHVAQARAAACIASWRSA